MSSRYREAAANVVRFAELETILSALVQAGVEAIVLKGAALATTYPNIAERPMSDVDLLVLRSQLPLAERCMLDMGYVPVTDVEHIGPLQLRIAGERGYQRQRGQFCPQFDLHWQLSPVEAYSRIDVDSLWEECRPLQVIGATGWQLSPRDTLLHVCVHLATHAFSHPVAYTDIKQVIAALEFSWESFIERVAQFRVKRVVYYALLLASQKTGASVPEGVLAALRPPCWQDRLVCCILHLQVTYSCRGNQLVFLHCALADNLLDAMRVLLGLIFPGPAWLEERYGVHGVVALSLVALVHPALTLVRMLGGWAQKKRQNTKRVK